MKISMDKTGGFAYLPGLERRIAVDTAVLEPQIAARLVEWVRQVGFFELPSEAIVPPGAADHQSYKITVIDGAREHAVTFADPLSTELSLFIGELEKIAP